MAEIGKECAESHTTMTPNEAAQPIGFPVIVRAAYLHGGFGSSFVQEEAQLRTLVAKAFASSPQVLVERSMKQD